MSNVPSVNISEADFTDGKIDILSILVLADLAKSRGEARRNVEQGGVSVDGELVKDIRTSYEPADFGDEGKLVKRGKKNFCKILLDK